MVEKYEINNKEIRVIRDDLLPGGTKIRALDPLIKNSNADEFVYPSPAYGFAQVAIAACCAKYKKTAVIFVAKRNTLYDYTEIAQTLGAKIVQVPNGYLSVVKKKADDYVDASPKTRTLISWGASDKESLNFLVKSLKKIEHIIKDGRVWVCVGSGTLLTAMSIAWPQAHFLCLVVGAQFDFSKFSDRTEVFRAKQKYEKAVNNLFPWPANSHYEAKLYPFVFEHGKDGDFVWNVAGNNI